MSKAPNETDAEFQRKNELMKLRESRELTMPELYELRDLTRNAISHMVFAVGKAKGAE